MNKIYEKGVTRNQQASSHTLAILMSMLRVCLEYGWSMARVWLGAAKEQQRSSKGAVKEQQRSSLEVAWSMVKVCLRYAYAIPTRFLRPFSSKRAELERRLVVSLLLMLTLGSGSVWGQTDYSGTYYIGNYNNNGYNVENPANNYYLVPAANPQRPRQIDAYYSANFGSEDGDPNQPFLTTYKTNKDANSVWIIEASGENGV